MICFDKETHTYTLDGVRLPSVTEIISRIIGNDYSEVPEKILKDKADFGNRMHEWIERYAVSGVRKRQSELMKLSTDQVKKIFENERILIHSVEKIIYCDKYAGTYDMYGTWKGVSTLFDIKTTAELHMEKLQWQLGMYKACMEEPVEKCVCLWCPKGGVVKLIEVVPHSTEEIEWMVYRYESEQYYSD